MNGKEEFFDRPKTTEDDEETVTDEYGAVFSKNMTKLIKGSKCCKHYCIPESVKEICESAFEFPEADDMEIIIPEGVKIIGDYAFYLSPNGVNLPESITTLGCSCFCTSFTIGKNVSEIAEGVSLYDDRIFVDPKNQHFTIYDDALYTKDLTRLLRVFSKKPVYRISKSVKKIDMWAFALCDNIKKLYIPSSVEYFGDDSLPDVDELEIIFED